jgi:translation initiation factor 2 subunit 1
MKVRKIGKEEICMVVRVDKENGYIDLSKKRVLTAEIPDATEKFVKGKTVQAIMRSVHEATGATLKDLYEKIVWPLQTDGSLCFDKFIRHIK